MSAGANFPPMKLRAAASAQLEMELQSHVRPLTWARACILDERERAHACVSEH